MQPYNLFPLSYAQQYAPQYQNYGQPAYQQPQPNQIQNQVPNGGYTPPTIHADIIQVENQTEAGNYPVAAGCTQMMMSKDDKQIYIKTAYSNAPYQLIVYNRAEPVEETKVDMNNFVTRDEFEKRLNEVIHRPTNNNNKPKQGDKTNG